MIRWWSDSASQEVKGRGLVSSSDKKIILQKFWLLLACLRNGSKHPYLENDVALLKISIPGSQSCAGHLFDEDLAAQSETVLYNKSNMQPDKTIL